jgi:hypothetical protein
MTRAGKLTGEGLDLGGVEATAQRSQVDAHRGTTP